MSNVVTFRNFLAKEKIPMQELVQDKKTYFRMEQKLKDGWKVMAILSFNEKEDIVDLFCLNVVEIRNPNKKPAVYELLNKLNVKFRYSKYYENNGFVSIKYSYLIEEYFNPVIAFQKLIMLLQTAEEAYPQLMEVIWSE
jgi:Fe-S oxidoreductase